MPAYYAMEYLSEVFFRVTTIGEHPHAKTPNAGAHLLLEAGAERTLEAVRCSALLARLAPRPAVIPHAPPDAPLPAWIVVGCMP